MTFENWLQDFAKGLVDGSTLMLSIYAVILLWRIEGKLRRKNVE